MLTIAAILIFLSGLMVFEEHWSNKKFRKKLERLFQEHLHHVEEFICTSTECITACNAQVKLLHQLNEILLIGRDPGICMLYAKVKQHGPMESPEAAMKLSQEVTEEIFSNVNRLITDKIEKTDNPVQKEKFENLLAEMMIIHSLYMTISPDSSKDYIETISHNITEMSKRINQLFQSMQEEGLFE